MFHFLGFIFFFILIVLLIGFVILWKIVNTFLGLGKRMTGGNPNGQNQQRTTYQRTDDSASNNARTQSSTSSAGGEKKKVFDDDEGEYVEFEEIKD